VSEIAGSTQINVSTAHRLLQTLTRRGHAEQNPDTGSYARGPWLLELGSAYVGHHDLIGAALPRLEELRDTAGETIYLAVYCVGVPLNRPPGRVSAAISIAMPRTNTRFQPESVAGWVRPLNETATRISGALGLSNGR
jgi:DNA-binding IclR family transcriptional regulator